MQQNSHKMGENERAHLQCCTVWRSVASALHPHTRRKVVQAHNFAELLCAKVCKNNKCNNNTAERVKRKIKRERRNKTTSQLGTRSIFALLSAPAGEVARQCCEIVLGEKRSVKAVAEGGEVIVGALLTYCGNYCLVTLYLGLASTTKHIHTLLFYFISFPLFLLHSLHCIQHFFFRQIFCLPLLYN